MFLIDSFDCFIQLFTMATLLIVHDARVQNGGVYFKMNSCYFHVSVIHFIFDGFIYQLNHRLH